MTREWRGVDNDLTETLYLISDNLAMLFYRLEAIEHRLEAIAEDQRLNLALTRQIWLNPAPGYTRVRVKWNENAKPGEEPVTFAGNVVRSERLPASSPKQKSTGVVIPSLE